MNNLSYIFISLAPLAFSIVFSFYFYNLLYGLRNEPRDSTKRLAALYKIFILLSLFSLFFSVGYLVGKYFNLSYTNYYNSIMCVQWKKAFSCETDSIIWAITSFILLASSLFLYKKLKNNK